jgi:exodeoxyribonuclease III
MLIFSWNVDGLSREKWNYIKENYLNVKTIHADILFIQETKIKASGIEEYFNEVKDTYDYLINAHQPANMHGVAVLVLKSPSIQWKVREDFQLLCSVRDDNKSGNANCGRVIAVDVVLPSISFLLVNTYTPNSGVDPKQPLKRLEYRVKHWDQAMFNALNKTTGNVVWIGDINVAPHDIDVSHPNKMKDKAGFTDAERQSINSFLGSRWVDIWRKQHPDVKGYSYRGYGKYSYKWRLDNTIVSESMVPRIRASFIIPSDDCDIETDHLPIGICV